MSQRLDCRDPVLGPEEELMTGTEGPGRLNHPRWALGVKRAADILGAVVALAIASPLLLGAALAIKLTSPGPVFYRGIRAGREGTTFRIFKFRSMVVNAESRGGPTTGTNDPRVTPVGRFLRKTKLDELPQFINVLLGDMSLVGPRPEVEQYASRYAGEEKLILAMRPGITDYASIEFADLDDRVGAEDPDKFFQEHILPRKNALRVRYVKEWSLASDVRILWATVFRVLRRALRR